jgi:rfaE bifunctional protein nucleotidyltransferase chain/domain
MSLIKTQSKILTLSELAAKAREFRAGGLVVVQAHGTFDLLHLGHVRHLEAARALGDVLVVTVTADHFVNKGPGRPAFTESLRAEMLAALHFVTYVATSEASDAISAIDAIRPDVYAKGSDYQNPDGDITGKITLERKAVEACGGTIRFTDEITFSSTHLINRHFNVFEPHVRDHLSELRDDGGLGAILNSVETISDYRVVLVGDAIIDEYQYVIPMGKPPKEHIIATRYQDKEVFAGGVFAAANHVASFCREVHVITCLGDDHGYDDLIRRSLKPNVTLHALFRPNSPTTLIKEICPAADVVISTDFGHGLIGPQIVDDLISTSRFLAVNTQSNSANMGYNLITRYPRADYICIDGPEARLALSDRVSAAGDIVYHLAARLPRCSKLIVTQGRHGCMTFERDQLAVHTIPAVARKIVDTVGAGDAFLAVTSPLVAAGMPMDLVGFVGNVVGALKVEIVGHRRAVDKVALIKDLNGLLK